MGFAFPECQGFAAALSECMKQEKGSQHYSPLCWSILVPVWGTCSILRLVVAFRWKCLLHLYDQGKYMARSQSLTEIGNRKTHQQDSSADSSHTQSPGGYFMSFCWGSFSKVNCPIRLGLGCTPFAVSRDDLQGAVLFKA